MSSCTACGSKEIEYDGALGNSVCVRCGVVLEENVVVAEVTYTELGNGATAMQGQFVAADRGRANLPHVFGRRNLHPTGPESSSSSSLQPPLIGSENFLKDTENNKFGDLEVNKYMSESKTVSAESRELTLFNGRRRLIALATAVALEGEHYVDAAHRWYALALNHQFTRGRRGNNVIAACLYIVCRQEKTAHMLLDFSDILQTSVYSLGGTFLRLVRLLNLEIPIVDPSFYVARFAAKLDFEEKTLAVANTAVRVVARMKRDWIQTGRRPAGICAAGLIIAARFHGFRRTEAEVVRVVRICEATLRRRLEEFGRTPSSQLTPQEFEGIWLEQEEDPPCFTQASRKANMSLLRRKRKSSRVAAALIADSGLKSVAGLKMSRYGDSDSLFAPTPPESQFNKDDGLLDSVVIDEDELDGMLLDAEEIILKTQLWTEMNKDYLEKEQEKERVRAIDQVKDISEVEASKDQMKKQASGKVKKPRAKRAPNLKDLPPAASPAEAVINLLHVKRPTRRLDHDALKRFLNDS